MTTVALSAMDSIDEADAKAEYSLESLRTNSLPLLPAGTLKLFNLQCTTSLCVHSSTWEKSFASIDPHSDTSEGTFMGIYDGSCGGL